MRVALAGLGGASRRGHLPAIGRLESERKLKLVAVADPDVERRAAVASQRSGLAVFESSEEMLATTACDVLVIATEPAAHARLVALGVQQRRHVVCEKPLTLTQQQQQLLTTAYSEAPDTALVGVHQYRYSPAWVSVSRWARAADRLRVPYSLIVDVERDRADPHAMSPWRADATSSGGMLADHGVHFLALGWTISGNLEVLQVSRQWDGPERERSSAVVRLGSTGLLKLSVSTAAARRRTHVGLHSRGLRLSWSDSSTRLALGGRVVRRRRVEALSDRGHVDALYLLLYRDLVANLRHPRWCRRRTGEALAVGQALVALLASTR